MMRPIDWLKALGTGLVVMAIDIAVATLVISLYVWFVDPGHPQAYYTQLAPRIATPCTAVVGPTLLFFANFRLGRGNPGRNAWAFAALVYFFYFLADWSIVAFQNIFTPIALAFMVLKLTGALLGAWASRRWPGSGSATA